MPLQVDILVIDDNIATLKTLSAGLEDMGYSVATAGSGQQAKALIKERPFNIVIVDIKLPDVSGLEILEAVKELNPEAAVIMITGHASIESAVGAINEGAYAYILKPVAMNELENIINNALREQRLLVENSELVESLQQSNKRMEEVNSALAQVSQVKSDFMAKMSHELRTPLNSIIGFSDVLLSRTSPVDPQTEEEFLNYINISAKHLLHLINSILDLSKVESGKMTVEPSEFELATLIEDVRTIVRPMLATKKQGLKVDIDKGITSIFADEPKIKQILLNLISNAHKFTPRRGKIEIVCRRQGSHQLHCSVIDNGIGINPRDQQKIFEDFGQAQRGDAKVRGSGAGLGLSIAKRLVEIHGGSIWVVSDVDCGSTFTFSIPITRKRSDLKTAKAD